jgi:serine/threonine-protein kinase
MLACPECRKPYPSDAVVCADHGCALVPLEALPDDEPAPLEPGTMVGEFRIERRLGSGSFGAVYAGEQPLIGKKVAIKVLHEKLASDKDAVSRFISEARAVNRIRHANVIDIFSFGTIGDKNQPYFVMELLDGVTLRELLQQKERLGVAEALPIFQGIADGLDAAHEVGVTHRDLKPDNIFLATQKGGGYVPKLLDFGVAKLIADDVAHHTATGAAIGTPSYMAPEQGRGKRVDHRADIYALGVVIHEALTGHRLFRGDSAMDVLLKHISEAPRPMSEVCRDVPKALDGPVLAMLAKSPRDRPSSAGAAVAALVERARSSGVARAAEIPPDAPAAAVEPTLALAGRGAKTAADTSGPVVISIGDHEDASRLTPNLPAPATTPDGRFAISSKDNTIKVWDLRTGQAVHTFPGQALPRVADASAAASALITAGSAPSPAAPAPATKPAGRSRLWAFLGVGAVIAIAAALQLGRAPAPAKAPIASVPGAAMPGDVTVRLAVIPSDADVLVDGLRVGIASDPLVLPRSDRRRALRIEKRGFEPLTLWIVADRDAELPPVALRPAPGASP